MSEEKSPNDDQERFKALVENYLNERNWTQARFAEETCVPHDEQRWNKFLNHGKPFVGRKVARRWATALRIPRGEVPSLLQWPVDEEEEAIEELAPYLERLSEAQRLPYYEVLQSLLGNDARPPSLTRVFVQPEYWTQTEPNLLLGGTAPELRHDLHAALLQHQNIVLQGAAGSGKSSVTSELTKEIGHTLQNGADKLRVVPIQIIAREFVESFKNEDFNRSVKSFIESETGVQKELGHFPKPPPYRYGKWLLIFDGVDEIVDPAIRYSLVTNILELAEREVSPYRLLVTGRPLEEFDRLKSPTFARYNLLPFREDQVAEFIEKWFGATAKESASDMTSEFHSWLKTGRLGEIATSPAMLTIAAIVFQYSADPLPASRADLYAAYTDIALQRKFRKEKLKETWGRDGALRLALSDKPKDYGEAGRSLANGLLATQKQFFQDCALRLQHEAEIDFIKIGIEMVLGAPWRDDIPYNFRSDPDELKPWINELINGSGVVQVRRKRYTFIHNTIREYLAAIHLHETLTIEQDRRALVQRWSEARWREIVLFFLCLTNRSTDDGLTISDHLRSILSSGDRGVHFAISALAEGVQVDKDTEKAIIAAFVDRINTWNSCKELLSTFRSPNPTEVIRMTSHDPRIRHALIGYVLRGGISCPKSSREIFALYSEIADPVDLEKLARNGAVLWMRVGAMSNLLRHGELSRARPIIEDAMPRLGARYGLEIVTALVSCGAHEELLWVVHLPQASKIVRLAALLFLENDELTKLERSSLTASLASEVTDWEPLTGDVLLRFAESEKLSLLLEIKTLRRDLGLKFCGALIKAGHGKATIGYLDEAFLTGTASDQVQAAKLLANLESSSELLAKVQALYKSPRLNSSELLELAKLGASLGDSSLLENLIKTGAISAIDKYSAIVFYARLDPSHRRFAFDTLCSIAAGPDADRIDRMVIESALAIDDSEAGVSAAIFLMEEYQIGGGDCFHKIANSNALARLVLAPKVTKGQRTYAVSALADLGEGGQLHSFAGSPELDFDLRVLCAEKLSDLGWTSEANTHAKNLLNESTTAQKVHLLAKHHVFGLENIAQPMLESIRANDDVHPSVRFEAAKLLAKDPWHQSPSFEDVYWLVSDNHSKELQLESVDWVTSKMCGSSNPDFPTPVRSYLINSIFTIIRDTGFEATLRKQAFDVLRFRFENICPPLDVAQTLVSLFEEADFVILSYLAVHQKELSCGLDLLVKSSRALKDNSDRISLAGLAFRSGYKDFALDEIKKIEIDRSSADEVLSYAFLLKQCELKKEAKSEFEYLISDRRAQAHLRFYSVHELFDWGEISGQVANDFIDVIAQCAESSKADVLTNYLSLAEKGATAEDMGFFDGALELEELPFDLKLQICRLLASHGKKLDTKTFLERSLMGPLGDAIAACGVLSQYMPETVTPAKVKQALSSFGKFELDGLYEICAGTKDHSDSDSISEEIVSFVVFCVDDPGLVRKFAQRLSQNGMGEIAVRFAVWLKGVSRETLIDDWKLEPSLADEFLEKSGAN